MDNAACKGMDTIIFFPPKGQPGVVAQMTCFSCSVRKECDDWKQESGSTDGIWAGRYSKRGNTE